MMNNLLIAFPGKTEKERIQIAKKFYHNLVDYFLESIKLITISNKEFYKRCSGDFDELNRLAATGTNIQLHSGHQFNWELANRIYSQKLAIPFVLVYMPISNKAIDKIFKKIRLRHGTVLIDATNYRKNMLGIYKKQHALALVADQSPANGPSAFWLNFFSRPTPFLYTPEKSAQRSKVPVGFASFKKIKRGYYKFETTMITLNAADTEKGELTRKYRDFLQQQILEQPDNYLWSHRRWKFEYKEEYEKLWID
ncbi:MAG: lipid biosynthesis acyltransferase [Chitinophagaceae bacterium]|nr:lipid biosynthesis acyltransferase [Chitinophagaceae bacterium]